jgi:hypothetical protein
MQVERYEPARHQPLWDDFVRASKNGTFLLLRGYMDYHADRFADHSLLVRDPEGELLAVLPAHADGDRLVSHGGLTYGGFISGPAMKTPLMLGAFEAVARHLRDRGFAAWVYKTVPPIYHRWPAEEDRYALFLAGAALARRDVLAVVGRHDRLPYQQRRERAVRKARQAGLAVGPDTDLAAFWEVLAENLRQRHGAKPLHTLTEIGLLRERFPENIRLFTSRGGADILGGVLIYESARVAHVQYIASSEEGRRLRALDLLFDVLLTGAYADKPYFDFGISNEDGGRRLNRGLIDQKEGFGARAVAHDHYAIELGAWEPGRLMRALS